jgi:hypothetical protein
MSWTVPVRPSAAYAFAKRLAMAAQSARLAARCTAVTDPEPQAEPVVFVAETGDGDLIEVSVRVVKRATEADRVAVVQAERAARKAAR